MKSLYQLFEEKLHSHCRNVDIFPFHLAKLEASYASLVLEKKISKAVARRLANSGLGLNHLHFSFKRDQNAGVKSILQERGFKEKTVLCFQTFFEDTHLEE